MMRAIEPGMVLGKAAVAGDGRPIGEVVDVGLYSHDRVKFLLVRDASEPRARVVAIDEIAAMDDAIVRLR